MPINCSVVVADAISLSENQRNRFREYDDGHVKRFGRVIPGFTRELGPIVAKVIQRDCIVGGIIQSGHTTPSF